MTEIKLLFQRFLNNPYRITICLFLALLTAILVSQIFLTGGFLWDERRWNAVALLWAHGVAPYMGMADNKSPGIFYVHLLANLFFKPEPYFARTVAVLLQLGGALLVYDMTEEIASPLERLWSLAAYIVLVAAPNTDPYNLGTTESFMYPFSVLGFWLYARAGLGACEREASPLLALLAGAAVGMAVDFKQIAVATLAALLAWAFLRNGFVRGCKHAALMLSGAVAVNALLLLPILLSGGTLHNYFAIVWYSLLNVATANHKDTMISWIMLVEWLPPLVFFVALTIRRREAWPFLLWLAADFAGSNASGAYYIHQFKQLIPSVALCAGLAMQRVFAQRREDEQYKILVRLMLGFCLLLIAQWLPWDALWG